MNNKDGYVLTYWILICLFSFFMGWFIAYNNVARECVKLNAFYVGDYVYECKVKE